MKRITLRMVFSLFVLIANTLVFSGYMAYYYLTIKAEMTNELKNSASSVSEWLSGALRMPLWSLDKKTTEDIIISGMNKQVWGVVVTDEFNKIFFGMKRNKEWKIIKSDELNFKGNFIKAERNIFDKASRIGKVEVYLTSMFMESQLTRSINSMILAIFIINVIIFLLLYFFVQYVIIRPIKTTVTYIGHLSSGDIPEIVMNRYIGEFNQIIESLNALIETTNKTTLISNEIAAGNISIDVTKRSENDHLMNSLKIMIQRLNAIMSETKGMIQRVSEGEHNVHGNAEAFQGVWRDLVTGVNHLMDLHMHAAEELLESEERLKLVLEGSKLGFWDWKIQTGEVHRNEQWANMLGYTLHEIKYNFDKWSDMIHPDDRAVALQSIHNHLEDKISMHKIEYRMLCKNGEWKWILDQARIVKRDDKGQPVRMSGTHADITERKESEESLRNEKERLMVTLRSIGDGVITTDSQSRIVLINMIAEELTGWRQDEAQGKHINEVFHIINEYTREICENPIEKVIKTGATVDLAKNTILVSRSGTELIVADRAAPIRNKDENIIGVVLVFRDITHQVLIENELRQSQKLESIGLLAGGIAHDFNNMLGVISGNISYALSKMDKNDNLWEVLNDVENGTMQAQKLTQQLLTFAKGGAPIKKEADLRDILKESALFVTRGSTVRCEFQFIDNLWAVSIDTGQMNQAISNIIINAAQSMPEGGIIQIQTENKTFYPDESVLLPPGSYVKISVKDNGIGISEKHISKIFDPYFTTKQKGSGLGLATTYSIIKSHNGHISVESKIGKGTTFYIYLPAINTGLVVDKKEKKVEHKGFGKILIMDDEEMIHKMLGRLLKLIGYETAFAIDGNQAIDMYKEVFKSEHPFDLVILDLTVPGGMGGAKTITELIKIDPDVKAIVSSGYSNDPIMANYKKYGFSGVLSKPFTKADIEEAIRSIIARSW